MSTESHPLESLSDVTVPLRVEIGHTELEVWKILNLQVGTVIPLDKLVGEPIDVYISERFSASGEVVVVNERYGVRISEIVRPTEE